MTAERTAARTAARTTARTTAGAGDYARLDGVDLYYESHGSGGRPLVLLHGGVQTIGLAFGALLPALAAKRRVIAVELQGHGHTADTDREMSVPAFAGDVVALLDLLGIGRADLFGFSLGGMTALETSLRNPERVGRQILMSVAFRPEGFLEEIRDPALHAGSDRLPTQADFAEMVAAYRAVAPDPDHFEAFLARCSSTANGHPGWTDEQLRALTVPTLLVMGDTDFMPVAHGEEVHRLIPGSRLAVLPGARHLDLPRRPELLLPLVEAFLAGDGDGDAD